MYARLLPLLITMMAAVLLALGFPLAAGQAAAQQQSVVVDRIDDTTRFAGLAQYLPSAGGDDDQMETLRAELLRYQQLYGIKVGVFDRNGTPIAIAPRNWKLPSEGDAYTAYSEALAGRRSHDPRQVWPWQHRMLAVASPVVRDGDVVAVVLADSPTGAMSSRILHGWLLLAAEEFAAMAVAVLAAFRLTGWVLRPVRVLDRATHDIATGRLKSRVAVASGPPELRRLALAFNDMADNVESVLEQQRAFVADASHQLRNPLSALLLRIELLGLELPAGNEEVASVREEGKRLACVVDDLLGLALAEHSEADLALTDVAALAAERVDAWRPVADRKGVEVVYDGAPAASGWADQVALSSALDAVVDNALKFTPEGEEVVVSTRIRGERVAVTVADRGPGLNPEELDRIGNRFWRSPRHQNIDGSGLGLSIAHALLTGGGGSIAYTPNQPHGLCVTLTVPRTGPDEPVFGSGATS